MKRLLLVLAAMFTFAAVNAQSAKNLQKAIADSQHPKKSAASATWTKLGACYLDVYDTPIKGIWPGASQTEVKMVLKDQPVVSSKQEAIGDKNFLVEEYADKKLYYDETGKLQAWTVTKPLIEGNPLALAYDAYKTAIEKDANKSNAKVINEGLVNLKGKYVNEAMNFYTTGNFKSASENFEKAVEISKNPAVNALDTTMLYYTAVTSVMSNDYPRSIKFFEECVALGYDQNGDVYASLSEGYKSQGDTLKSKETLAAGFTKYPTNQSILVSLINIYQESNDDPNKILDLLKVAQKNEPTNASLFYAEGNILKKMGKYDEALKTFDKSLELNPQYFYAPFAKGDCYYQMAIEYQNQANNEMDDAKYTAYVAQLEDALMKAIEPFEQAFAIATDNELKVACAEYLKNIYFRFREKDPKYAAGYEKYNKIASGN